MKYHREHYKEQDHKEQDHFTICIRILPPDGILEHILQNLAAQRLYCTQEFLFWPAAQF